MEQSISLELAAFNVQTRFMSNLTDNEKLLDVPMGTIHAFVVDVTCTALEIMSDKVILIYFVVLLVYFI